MHLLLIKMNIIKLFKFSGNITSTFKSAEDIILQWGSAVSEEAKELMIFNGDGFRIDQYLQAIDEIHRRKGCARTSYDQSEANKLIQIAMSRLADEFRIMLNGISPLGSNSHTNPNSSHSYSITDSSTTGSYEDYDYYSEQDAKIKETISDLKSIAAKMNSAGHLPECVKVFKGVRKSFIAKSFERLGIYKLSVAEVPKLEWPVLEEKIGQWVRAANICFRSLFVFEKRLCEQIFETLGTAATDACFTEIVKDDAVRLFAFAGAISNSRRSPERFFTILDLHDSLFHLLPVVDSIFQAELSRPVFLLATGIQAQLAEAVRGILLKFENDVLHENSNFQDHKGGILPLTSYVMNYICEIFYNRESLAKLIVSVPTMDDYRTYSNDMTIPDLEFCEVEGRAPLAIHLIWIIHLLQIKLRIKSKYYNDAFLAHLFIINNFHYIVETIRISPPLQNMIGNQYVEKLNEIVGQEMTTYRRGIDRLFHCLRDDGPDMSVSFSSGVSKISLLEKRLKTFNALFEEICSSSQATWFIEDLQLREALQLLILDELIPNYRVFLGIIKDLGGNETDGEIAIKYSIEDLHTSISNFFKGVPRANQSNPTVKIEGHPIRHRYNSIVRCWKCF